MRTAFSTLDAFTRETATEKEKIIEALNTLDAEKIFKKFKSRNIIQKYNDKYFYDKSKEILLTNNYLVTVFIIAMIVIGISAGLMYTNSSEKNSTVAQSKMVSQEICYKKISIDVPEDFKKEIVGYEESVLFYNNEGDVSIRVNCTEKELLGEYNLTDYKVEMEKHLKDSYSLEKDINLEEGKIGKYSSYNGEFDTVYSGSRLHSNVCIVEMENYFVEIYTFSLRSKQSEYKTMFDKVINSIKEVE